MPRQQLADADALGLRGDRPERAADLGRGVGLGVVGLQVARPALEPDDEQRGPLAGRGRARPRPQREQVRQGEAGQAPSQEFAATHDGRPSRRGAGRDARSGATRARSHPPAAWRFGLDRNQRPAAWPSPSTGNSCGVLSFRPEASSATATSLPAAMLAPERHLPLGQVGGHGPGRLAVDPDGLDGAVAGRSSRGRAASRRPPGARAVMTVAGGRSSAGSSSLGNATSRTSATRDTSPVSGGSAR